MNEKKQYPPGSRFVIILLGIILLIYALIEAREFLYPIVLGLLFGYLLFPVANFLEKHNIPRILANFLSIILFLIIVGGALLMIYKQTGGLIDNFPVYKKQALENIDKLEGTIEEYFGLSDLRLVDFIRERVRMLFEEGNMVFNKAFSATAGTLFRIGILPVYIFLFLFYRTKLANFILKLTPKDKRIIAIKVLRKYSLIVPRYLGGVSTVVFILAILNSAGLILIGIEHAILFGIISALCNFIPYFGTLIGGSIPFVFSLLVSPHLAIAVLILFIIIQFTENNILTPNIVGNALNLNPMIIIIGIVAGGMVWGIPGMFAVAPLLAMLNILSENVSRLQPYSFLLGIKGARRHAFTKENIQKFLARFKKSSNS